MIGELREYGPALIWKTLISQTQHVSVDDQRVRSGPNHIRYPPSSYRFINGPVSGANEDPVPRTLKASVTFTLASFKEAGTPYTSRVQAWSRSGSSGDVGLTY